MSSAIEKIEAEALRLSPTERAHLVERLIASLDLYPPVEEAWAAEVERRNREVENGKVSLVSGPDAVARLRALFK